MQRLVEEIDAAVQLPPERLAEDVKAALRTAVTGDDWLPPERRRANHECYARHILYGDPAGRFSILSIVWDHEQQSPIHGHHTWCAVGVYAGELTESRYRENADGSLSEIGVERAGAGAVGFDPQGGAIHSIQNRSGAVAVSLHVYGVGADRVTTAINRLYPRPR